MKNRLLVLSCLTLISGQAGAQITDLYGDVTATGPGNVPATVSQLSGSPIAVPTGPVIIGGTSGGVNPTLLNILGPVTSAQALGTLSEGAFLRTATGPITYTAPGNQTINANAAAVSFNGPTMQAVNSGLVFGSAATVRCAHPPVLPTTGPYVGNLTISPTWCFYSSNGDNFFRLGNLVLVDRTGKITEVVMAYTLT